MINCTLFNAKLNIAEFVVDTVEELELLPNLISEGQADLKGMSPVEQGSTAYCIDEQTRYILNGENNWEVFISRGGSGGGSGNGALLVEDIEDLLDEANYENTELYIGMLVVVKDPGAIYILLDPTDVSDINSWKRTTSVSDGLQQVTEFPAVAENGTIVEYMGPTNADLTHGFFYQFNGTEWEIFVPVKSSGSSDGLCYITVSKTGYVTTVRAEDSRGVTTTYITDGRDGVDGVDGITPTIAIGANGNWVINSIDTGVHAQGAKGDKGDGFSIDKKYATTADMVADTDNVNDGQMAIVIDDKQLYIKIDGYTEGDYDNWMAIGGLGDLTVIKGDKGDQGDPGTNGVTPTIDPTTKHWMIGTYDTGVVAEGKDGTNGTNGANGIDGITPSINSTTKHWMLGSLDTGIVAEGFTPTVGINASGNWVVNNIDTGKSAFPIINSVTKHWEVDGTDTGVIAEAKDGDKGDKGDDGFSPTITQERDDNKVTLTINQKTGTEVVEIFDGLNSYNDLELRTRISATESALETLNGDDTVTGSIEFKIADAFSKFTSIKFEIVTTLPASGINGVFYLVPSTRTSTQNIYDEYIYVDNRWEFLGTTELDLTSYAKKTDLPTKVSDLTNDSGFITSSSLPGTASTSTAGLVKVDGTTITIDSNGVISGTQKIGVSAEAGNTLTTKSDGLYVPATDLSAYAKTANVPSKTSQLTNDSGFITASSVPTKLSDLTNDLIATTKKAGTVIPDGDTVTIDGNGTITATIGENSLSRDEGNQIELHDDGIYIGALNEEAIYNSIDAVDLASPILTEYTEDELYHLAWEEIEVKEKEEYTEAELDEMLDNLDLSGIGGGGADNIIESISVNGVDIPPDANKNIALTIMTNSVNDLVNYYKKTETYTKTEIDSMLSNISGGSFTVVASLPLTDIDTKTIYLVPKTTSETSNVYDEYVYINDAWEKIGDTQIDLSGYVTTSAMTSALDDKQDAIAGGTAGQILKKQSNIDGDFDWEDETIETQEISQADFDALSQAEKDNGTAYFISDGDGLVNKTAMGYTPIGTIISVMGNTAPKHYLACDGSVVNILDYPELANYFNTQFGSKNYFGGDGVTTFAVPDLRGEFLRGTGTNSHENQGSGSNVGVHQDGTWNTYVDGSGVVSPSDFSSIDLNHDITYPTRFNRNYISKGGTDTNTLLYTSRPTNTSVLYCIATKNIYIDPKNNYSTEEQVVGTWIDGKPLYQKTLKKSNVVNQTEIYFTEMDSVSFDLVTYSYCFKIRSSDKLMMPIPWHAVNQGSSMSGYDCSIQIYPNDPNERVQIRVSTNISQAAGDYYIVLQYTKTTD